MTIQVRLRNQSSTIVDRIRSAAISVIHNTPVGTSIAISSIVAAIDTVTGGAPVSVISPEGDQIILRGSEKGKVVDPNDIQVIVAGN